MEVYEQLRHFADSWGLLMLLAVFICVLLWVSWPGSRKRYVDQANIPFKHDEKGD